MIKSNIIIYLFLVFSMAAQNICAQHVDQITIDQCYDWASSNYPQIRQLDIIQRTQAYNLSNASKGHLPQINIHGQVTYQSDVTQFPIDIPNVDVPGISKDQYKLYGDVFLPLTNKAAIKNARHEIESRTNIEKQEIEIELYHLRERVNQMYFGILLMDNNLQQIKILQTNLDVALEKTKAAIANGLAIESDGYLIDAELIKSFQREQELRSTRKAYLFMLATLTHQNIDESTTVTRPIYQEYSMDINRLELQLIDLQNKGIDLKYEVIQNELMPSAGLFLQSGYGRPALNFLSNNFEFYYIGGIKVNWNISNYYTSNNKKQILVLLKEKLTTKKETFLLNTDLSMTQQTHEIEKYQTLMTSDHELIAIRQHIKETAEVQLTNGLISPLDYINYVQAEHEAMQNFLLHQVQLLKAQYNLKTTSGN